MNKYINKIKENKVGAIALVFVVMITTLTIVSSLVLALINVSEITSSYHESEAESTDIAMDACLDDAIARIASSTSASGTYSLNSLGINCSYEISAAIVAGLKTVTSTASSSSSLGNWQNTVIMQVNVSTTPISIYSYKHSPISYQSYEYCGDSACGASESCSSCEADCGSCQVCGNGATEGTEVCDDGNTTTETQTCGNSVTENGTYCNADCTAQVVLTEVCDDGNTSNEACGDGVKQNGTYCNSTCSATIVRSEACDYTGGFCSGGINSHTGPVGCSKNPYCNNTCSSCTSFCL